MCYLAVQAHPAAIECTFAEPGRSTQIVFPCCGIDHLQALISHRPIHTEVWRFPRLTSLCVANPCRTRPKLRVFQMARKKSLDGLPLTAEQWPVQAKGLWQIVDFCDPLVHGSGEVVGMVQAAQDDA